MGGPPLHRRTDLLSVATIWLALVLCSGAWFWPVSSAVTLEVEGVLRTEFKAVCYAAFVAQAARGIHLPLAACRVPALLFVVQLMVLLASVGLSGEWFHGAQALATFAGITFGAMVAVHRLGAVAVLETAGSALATLLLASLAIGIAVPEIGQHGAELRGEWRGVFAHKNQLGLTAMLGVGLALPLWALGSRRLAASLLILAAPALLLAGSATALAASLLSCLLMAAWTAAGLAGGGPGMRLALLALTTATAVLGFVSYDADIVELLGRDATLTGRVDIWWHLYPVAVEALLLGHGPSYLIVDQALMDYVRQAADFASLRSAHSAYLEALLEFGIAGPVVLIGPYATAAVLWFRARQASAHKLGLLVLTLALPLALHNVVESANRIYFGPGTLLVNVLLAALAAAGAQAAPSRPVRRGRPLRPARRAVAA